METIRVLVVDDCSVARIGLAVLLQRMPFVSQVITANGGKEAVRLMASQKPDVALIDLDMPDCDGIETTRKILALMPNTPILILTADESNSRVVEALKAGARGYCKKDVRDRQIEHAISATMCGATWLSPGLTNHVLLQKNTQETTRTEPLDYDLERQWRLSPREREILQLVCNGLSNRQIAEKLYVSVETVKTHLKRIMEKMMVSDRTEAAVKAVKAGISA